MPNQNQSDPNSDQSQQSNNDNAGSSVSFSPQADLPPLPPEFQNIQNDQVGKNPEEGPIEVPENTGSAAPPVPDLSNITSSPKKKFGTKRIIATILGILMLVGGVGAGIAMINQKQLFQQKATDYDCGDPINSSGNFCTTNCAYGHSQSGNCYGANEVCCNLAGGTPPPGNYNWPPDGTQCKNSSGKSWGCVTIFCPNGCGDNDGCNESDNGAYWTNYDTCEAAVSALGNSCGQVDVIDESKVYCNVTPEYKDAKKQCSNCTNPPPKTPKPGTPTPTSTSTPTPTPTSTPTNPPTAPYCAAIYIYDTGWNPITSSDSKIGSVPLVPNTTYRFTVKGSPANIMTKARFIIKTSDGEINLGLISEDVTSKKPNTNEFYIEYTVPVKATSVDVKAQVYNGTNWY